MEFKNAGKKLIKLLMTAPLLAAALNVFATDTINLAQEEEALPIPTIDEQNEDSSDDSNSKSEDKGYTLSISQNDTSTESDKTEDEDGDSKGNS